MRENERRILIGAQSWAFGPAGKASAIGHAFQKLGIKTCFVGGSTSFSFCKSSEHFDDFIEVSSAYDYLKLQKDDFSMVISVMDPYLAVWAVKKNLPVYYVDSMSWFWNWEDSESVEVFTKNFRGKGVADDFKYLDALPPDTRQLIAHQISKSIFSQGRPQVTTETKKKAKNVGPVIDLLYRENSVKRDTIIISLSGGISPANSLEEAVRYANMVVDLIFSGRSESFFQNRKFIITGHPEVIKNMHNPHRAGVELKALSHPDFLRALNKAAVVFIPCGFTTIYEALAYRVPVVFLPENHNGHVYEYLTITAELTDRDIIFPNMLFTLSESSLDYIRPIDDSMALIGIYAKEYWNSVSYRERCREKINDIFCLLSQREKILKKQTEAILRLVPDFGGADRVVRSVVADFL